MSKANHAWCDRGLFASPVAFGLCTTKKQFDQAMDEIGVQASMRPPFFKGANADATAHIFQGDHGTNVIVCISPEKRVDPVETYGLLVHEAVHIWQRIREQIGEDKPSAEFEAYSIQAIAQQLMWAHHAQTKGKGK